MLTDTISCRLSILRSAQLSLLIPTPGCVRPLSSLLVFILVPDFFRYAVCIAFCIWRISEKEKYLYIDILYHFFNILYAKP